MPVKTIPRGLIKPYVEKYLEEREMGEVFLDAENPDHIIKKFKNHYSAQEALADEAGVPLKRIYEIRCQEGNLAITTADKLICAMNMPELWWIDDDLRAALDEAA